MKTRLRLCFALLITFTAILVGIGVINMVESREWIKKKENVSTTVQILEETGALDEIIRTKYEIDPSGYFLMVIDSEGNVLYTNDSPKLTKIEIQTQCPDVWNAYTTSREGAWTENREEGDVFWIATNRDDGTYLRVGITSTVGKSSITENIAMMTSSAYLAWIAGLILSFFVIEWTTKPFKDLAEDTEGKLAEEEIYPEVRPYVELIQRQKEDLRKNAEIKEEFFSNITHELKTPLASILGSAQAIESGECDEQTQKQFATEIVKSTKRLNGMVQEVLTLSELDLQEQTLMKKEKISLFDLAEMCVASLQKTAQEKGISLSFSGERYEIYADPIMIETLIYNLITNAIRYNRPNGSITISVSDRICVSDTGIGMSKEQQKHIFERFYRVDKKDSREKGGNGLGLAIVYEIVKLHDAEILVDSEENAGTTITVIFPQAKVMKLDGYLT